MAVTKKRGSPGKATPNEKTVSVKVQSLANGAKYKPLEFDGDTLMLPVLSCGVLSKEDKKRGNTPSGQVAALFEYGILKTLMLKRCGYIYAPTLQIWVGTHWKVITEARLLEILAAWSERDKFPDSMCSKLVLEGAMFYLQRGMNLQPPSPDSAIAFSNGTITIGRRKIEFRKEHKPEFGANILIKEPYSPTAINKRFDDFIKEVMGIRKIDRFCESMSLIFLRGQEATKVQSLLILAGAGGNGKSVCIDAIEYAIGTENTARATVEEMLSPTGVYSLLNKMLNVVSEVPSQIANAAKMNSTIKLLSGAEAINARLLYENAVKVEGGSYARSVIIANRIPQLEGTFATERRIQIVKFVNKYKGRGANKNLLDEIKNGGRAGIVNWLLQGLKRFLDNEYNYSDSEEIDKANAEYIGSSDSVRSFFGEQMVKIVNGTQLSLIRTGHGLIASDVYEEYKKFCKEAGNTPLGRNNFYNRAMDDLEIDIETFSHVKYITSHDYIQFDDLKKI